MTPGNGWINEIRRALGMSASQLARRIGVSQPAVTQYERNEANSAITLGTLRKAASALECEFVYALVPKAELGEIRERQARKVAEIVVGRVVRSMDLENQSISSDKTEQQVEDLTWLLLEEQPRLLWNDP